MFAFPEEPLGIADRALYHIKLKPDTKLVYISMYRLPHNQRTIFNNMFNDMLEQGLIQESRSLWNSPLFFIPKNDGTFSHIRAVTLGERYPLSVLNDLLMPLGRGNSAFSSLDLLSGCWLVELEPSPREIKVFGALRGHYEWLRLPFGLKPAPLTLQKW